MIRYLLLLLFITSLNILRGQDIYFIDGTINNTTINTCSGFVVPSWNCLSNYLDGFGNPVLSYCNNENYTVTFCSGTPGRRIAINFIGFYSVGNPAGYSETLFLDDGYDFLKIYDGPSTASPLLANLTGVRTTPFSYKASGECLTLNFTSDNIVKAWGFNPILGCEPLPCNSNPLAGDLCTNAPQICDLNGYCGNTSGWYTADSYTTLGSDYGGSFCGSIENNSWIKFVASSTNATLNINSSSCSDPSSGIQARIYSSPNCSTFTPVSNCVSQLSGSGSFTISNSTPLTPGQTYYLMIDGYAGNTCNYTVTAQSGVQVLSITGPAGNKICNGQTATLTINGASSGATYNWQPVAAISGSNTGSSITANATSTTTYTCTVTSTTGCLNDVASYTLTVNPLPTISLGSNPSICKGTTSASISYTSTSGSPNQYSIDFNFAANSAGLNDVVNASLPPSPISITVPSAIAANTYSGTLTVTNSTTGCVSSSYPISITVTNSITPTFSAVTPICKGDPAPTLPTTSTNSISGTWNPSSVSNTATGTYNFTPTPGQCASNTSLTVTVNNPATPTFSPISPICNGDPAPTLPTTSNNGITGTWNPSSVSNTASDTYIFTPTAGQCASGTTISVTVNNPVTPAFNPISPICNGDTAPTLPTTSTNGISGTWNPSSVSNTANGTYIFTPSAGQCGTTTSTNVIVNPRPTISPVYHD